MINIKKFLTIIIVLVSIYNIIFCNSIHIEKEIMNLNWGSNSNEIAREQELVEENIMIWRGPKLIITDKMNNIYIGDTYNNCIKKFNLEGNFLKSLPLKIGREGILPELEGIAIDKNYNIYYSTLSTNSVIKINQDGIIIDEFKGKCKNRGKFIQVGKLAVDNENNLYVEDIESKGKSAKFTIKINTIDKKCQYYNVWNITIDSKNNIWSLTDYKNFTISKFNNKGKKLKSFNLPIEEIGGKRGQYDITLEGIDNEGNLYFWYNRHISGITLEDWKSESGFFMSNNDGKNLKIIFKIDDILEKYNGYASQSFIDLNGNIFIGISTEEGFKVIKYEKQ